MTTNTTHAANEHLYKKLPYDPVKDFAPVTGLGKGGQVLVVRADAPYKQVTELIAAAKQRPGKLSFGSGSSSSRVAGEMFKQLSGTDILHVPYKSNPQVVTDLLGGQISLFFGDVSTSMPPVAAGKLKGYAVSGLKRSPLAPDLPTLNEAGLPGYDLTAWFAAFVPARTPKPVIDKLNAAMRAALADPEVSGKLRTVGIEPETGSPEELKAFVNSEIKKWAKIVADAKIEPE